MLVHEPRGAALRRRLQVDASFADFGSLVQPHAGGRRPRFPPAAAPPLLRRHVHGPERRRALAEAEAATGDKDARAANARSKVIRAFGAARVMVHTMNRIYALPLSCLCVMALCGGGMMPVKFLQSPRSD